jgi:hypothetical protein
MVRVFRPSGEPLQIAGGENCSERKEAKCTRIRGVKMEPKADIFLLIDPPILFPWQTPEDKRLSVVLLGLACDLPEVGKLRMDLDVVFNPLPIRRGKFAREDFWVGSTGVEVALVARDGIVLDSTRSMTIEVSYSNKTTGTQNVSIALSPAVKKKKAQEEFEVGGLGLTMSRGRQREFATTFDNEERILAASLAGDTVRWLLMLPHGDKAVRDFLFGNLYLFATCNWPKGGVAGEVFVRPLDVLFFGSDRRPLNRTKSLAMEYVLWRRGVKLKNRDGIHIRFEQGAE